MQKYARFMVSLPEITAAHPTARWIFLTLTVPNVPTGELRATVQNMARAWNVLTRHKRWPALGAIRALEITRNEETNEAHPHYHALLLVPCSYWARDYIPQREWQSWWGKATGHARAIVDVRKVQDATSGAGECLKYAVKVPDYFAPGAKAWIGETFAAIHGLKQVTACGVLRRMFVDTRPEQTTLALDAPSAAMYHLDRPARRYRRDDSGAAPERPRGRRRGVDQDQSAPVVPIRREQDGDAE